MTDQTSAYIRQVLHHTEPPPPAQARFFYTSPLAIDDPLSPLPPPATAATLASKQPPRPFSEYDNTALDKAWHELRSKILKYNEERGEKDALADESKAQGSALRDFGSRDGKQRASGGKPSTPRAKATRPRGSTLEGETDLNTSLQALDDPSLEVEAVDKPDTTGTPFIRAPSRKKLNTLPFQRSEPRSTRPKVQARDTYKWEDPVGLLGYEAEEDSRPATATGPSSKVAVGVSRLHNVEMPALQMTPIYWDPVHDIAQVSRSTWFYRETMLPVETPVANMLEAGYVDLQAWTETWKDELNSAVEVGAAGEMKILHKLWPDTSKSHRPSMDVRPGSARENLLGTVASNLVDLEPDTPDRQREKSVEAACDIIDVSTGPGGHDNKASGTSSHGLYGPTRHYGMSGVIYANEREAYILKPNLQPSTYYGRRPLANYIRKGRKLGIAVVRGFDQLAYEKLHPSKITAKEIKAEQGTSSSQSGAPPDRRAKIDPDLAKSERPKVTDLILVIHGIGQKLSERVESFHFTHAINSFRREVNVELGASNVKVRLSKDMGGIMVLPVNWRHSLSFEEGGYRDGPQDPAENQFSLADITPDTLPSVRNIVSDVMLDIPYYLSHHQPKMIAAVLREANNIYQLWCQNNPGFSETGRVHILAHSLGSVMAIDILSRQPTTIPKHLADPTTVDLQGEQLDHFLFPTSNLYLCGSPAGFFLLLKKASLLPRIDHPCSDTDPSSNTSLICGESGTYGCIAVENIYNIINPYDPVAYRMNACVDSTYAASLKPAWIPYANASWFGSNSWFAGSGTGSMVSTKQPTLPRLPSNVELETHNFTREEIAEKRMYLLNDNGQIDYFLRYGGGPLEIQYLTMLGAHSSYWVLKDFVRMIVTETGRERGKEGTVMAMRAVKKKVQLA